MTQHIGNQADVMIARARRAEAKKDWIGAAIYYASAGLSARSRGCRERAIFAAAKASAPTARPCK